MATGKKIPFFVKTTKNAKGAPVDIAYDESYEREILKRTQKNIRNMMLESTRSEFDIEYFARNRLGVHLFSNQIQLVKAICDHNLKWVASLQARQGGKSFSVSAGITIAADKDVARNRDRGTYIGVFANKEDQAYLVRDKVKHIMENSDYMFNRIDWKRCTKKDLWWKPKNQGGVGSLIRFLSASEQAHIEGETFDIIVLDESQKISDHVFEEAIKPMGGSTNAKTIQIGTPRRKNHFFNALEDPKSSYVKVIHDWTQCPRLWEKGAIMVNERPYSEYVMSLMPLVLRQEVFPENPIIKYNGKTMHLWDYPLESGRGMSIKRFRTQYMLYWLADADAYLSNDEWKKLATGEFDILQHGNDREIYYAGIDCSGNLGNDDDYEEEAAGSEERSESHTSISIVRLLPNGTKQKVYHEFLPLAMDWVEQSKRFIELFHQKNGQFAGTRRILIDIGNVGKPIVDYMKAAKLPVEGILYQAKDKLSQKNYKNAMYDEFKFELTKGAWLYSNKVMENADMKTAYLQWEDLECEEPKSGINKKFRAGNSGRGDDAPNSDVMAGYAMKIKPIVKKVRPAIGNRI